MRLPSGRPAHFCPVLRNARPVAAGMPQAGSMPLPEHLSAMGVKARARVFDARLSATAYDAAVLHCAPEAAVGAPPALVEDGDLIALNVPARRLHAEHVLQASPGADLDFM